MNEENYGILTEKISNLTQSIGEVLLLGKQNSNKTDELKIDIEKLKTSHATSRNIWSAAGGILCVLIGALYAQNNELNKKQDDKIESIMSTQQTYMLVTDNRISKLEVEVAKKN